MQPKASDRVDFPKDTHRQSTGVTSSGLTEGADDETKGRYAFVCGDFSRIRRERL